MRAVDNGFAGAVLVAQGDEVTLSKGYGVADRDRGSAVTAAT
jgi:CubicO group peptidase (beta-lactamase class C family)